MNRIAQCLLYLQYLVGRLSTFVIAPPLYLAMRCMGYRVRNLKQARNRVEELFEKHGGPWIVCPNHLTMIDSVILAYAMAPMYRYMIQYRRLPWNLPERANFQSNIFLAVLCYLTKCIPVSRGGDRRKVKSTMDKCAYLLKRGESLLIFPEGKRSRTGRVDTETFSYGVGRLIAHSPDCGVMCIYLRGDGQKMYSNIPQFGECFTIQIEAFKPDVEGRGLKKQRECARQIVEHLALMEKDYFDRQRYC
jgi:1-acyl-sn-glycerol-3-phosphate acyltransferase